MSGTHQYPEAWVERFRGDPLARQVVMSLATRSSCEPSSPLPRIVSSVPTPSHSFESTRSGEQGMVPLVASLHAYRLAHKTYWDFTREAAAGRSRRKGALNALTMLSDFWLELFDAVGAVLEETHAGTRHPRLERFSVPAV